MSTPRFYDVATPVELKRSTTRCKELMISTLKLATGGVWLFGGLTTDFGGGISRYASLSAERFRAGSVGCGVSA